MAVTITTARAAAFDILMKIERNQGHCDDLLRTRQVEVLAPLDRNLCTNLVMGTLRWQIALDAEVNRSLKRPEGRLSDEVRIALRLGAFQLLYLDRIPAHAAISESVELAKRAENKFAAGMVNAVLRKVAAGGARSKHDAATAAGIAGATAHPVWLVERWAAAYGLEAAAAICAFNQEQPPLHLRCASDGVEDTLKGAGIELEPGAYLSRARKLTKGDVTTTVAYRDGLVRIQDEGSQLVAELAGAGRKILDCCAAPGGKTMILAENNPESDILACDVSLRRLDQMKGMLRALPKKVQLRFQVADAARPSFKDEYDLVLCDVPCSGTGTIARNPEIRHRLKPEDITRHHERQVTIASIHDEYGGKGRTPAVRDLLAGAGRERASDRCVHGERCGLPAGSPAAVSRVASGARRLQRGERGGAGANGISRRISAHDSWGSSLRWFLRCDAGARVVLSLEGTRTQSKAIARWSVPLP